jgi:hypothetical protein
MSSRGIQDPGRQRSRGIETCGRSSCLWIGRSPSLEGGIVGRRGRRLAEAGIVGWDVNVAISDERGVIGFGDVVFRKAKVVIEVDGWAFHVTPDRFQRDRERQNRLVAAGWIVLRFTWRDLTQRPGYVVDSIASILAHRS